MKENPCAELPPVTLDPRREESKAAFKARKLEYNMPYKIHEEDYSGDNQDDDYEIGADLKQAWSAQQTMAQAQMSLSILQLDALNLKSDTEGLQHLKEKAVKFLSDYLDS